MSIPSPAASSYGSMCGQLTCLSIREEKCDGNTISFQGLPVLEYGFSHIEGTSALCVHLVMVFTKLDVCT